MISSGSFRVITKLCLACIAILAASVTASSQTITQKIPDKARVLFLLDGSASMFGEWERTLKIRAARGILTDLVDSLRVNEDVELALRIYGHQFPIEQRNCTDTELEIPFGQENHDRIITMIRDLEPKGTTPIAYSLEQAVSDFPQSDGYRNIVIIITDGVESCGGDPCEVSTALQRRGIFLKPFVIGLAMEADYRNDFACIGTYYDAKRIPDFRKALNRAITQSLKETTVTVELLGLQGQRNESDVNVSFINHLSGQSMYEFVHYRDPQGRTDTLTIEPGVTYDIVVNTIPPVRRTEVTLVGGEHNEIEIPSPQGSLQLNLPSHTRYENGVKALIKRPGTDIVVHVQEVPGEEKYLVGTYDVDVLTIPKTRFRNVQIRHKEKEDLTLPAPGLVNMESSSFIFGTIYELDGDNETWVMNLETKNTITKLAMQPGSYKIAFRTKKTFGSKYTAIKFFTIRSRESLTLNLFKE